MAEAKLVDYYAILNLPPRADLQGIENAYARLSDELAHRMDVDETSGAALHRLNEAYSVLSRPELRREYDRAYFVREREVAEKRQVAHERRREGMRRLLVYSLGGLVALQVLTLVVVGRGEIADILQAVVSPLLPGDAQ
ncbi:MAG: DnaJ domain-containing protein [Dehalococcoidia bacterium]